MTNRDWPADWHIMNTGRLPPYYMTKNEARRRGWRSRKGNLAEILPDIMIGGDIYWDDDEKLPVALERVWYEADINYLRGFRNDHRLFYSNAGLVFVSY